MPQAKCPHCGKVFDCCSGDDGPPSPGDFTLCIECCGWLVFTPQLTVRRPTPEEGTEIAGSADCAKAFAAMMTVRRMQAAKN